MRRLGSLAFRSVVTAIVLLLAWSNLKLYFPPTVEADFGKVPRNALPHLNWLKEELEGGAGEEMQKLFPEGYFFSHALYGLAWVEMGLRSDAHRKGAVQQARWALGNIRSSAGRAPFPSDLPPGHGMFYSGWRNHLLSGIVLLGGEDAELDLLRSWSDELAVALEGSSAWPWLASYRGQVWPCDAPPGVHAMCVYDHVTGEGRYSAFVKKWVDAVANKLDPEYGMITHMVDAGSGLPVGFPRGTSQTILLRFLADIDPGLAIGQYRLFQRHFLANVWGLPGVLEYPRGVRECGDVDSGPLVAGMSISATVVGMGVAQLYGDHAFARAVSQSGEVAGLPMGAKQRKYLGGVLPVGDAFVVHATTARPWLRDGGDFDIEPTPVTGFWRWGIHLLSMSILGLVFLAWKLLGFCLHDQSRSSRVGPCVP
jgi:hypothetical protein